MRKGKAASAGQVAVLVGNEKKWFHGKTSKNDTATDQIWDMEADVNQLVTGVVGEYERMLAATRESKYDHYAIYYFEKVLENQQHIMRRRKGSSKSAEGKAEPMVMANVTPEMLKLWNILQRKQEVGVEEAQKILWSEGASRVPEQTRATKQAGELLRRRYWMDGRADDDMPY